MRVALTNARILTPSGFREDLAVVIEDGLIAGIGRTIPRDVDVHDLGGIALVPGFVDVQVNGGGGRLFNDDPSVETIECMIAAHRAFGTTGMLPTLITDDFDVLEQAMMAVDQAIEKGVPGILGIHLEGPFLAPSRKGAHREDKLRVMEDRHLALLKSLRRGVTHITLAPEAVSLDQIRSLTADGIRVSIGHTNADYATTVAALGAGATGFTHLFNAMSQLTSREPGVVGAAFTFPDIFAGIIVDGEHVHRASIETALRALGPDRLMLVTDAMALAGTDLDSFELQGRTITKVGDSLRTDDGTLAGSAVTMIGAVRRMIEYSGATFESVIKMASTTPANFLGLSASVGHIGLNMRANLVGLNDSLEVVSTWIDGEMTAS